MQIGFLPLIHSKIVSYQIIVLNLVSGGYGVAQQVEVLAKLTWWPASILELTYGKRDWTAQTCLLTFTLRSHLPAYTDTNTVTLIHLYWDINHEDNNNNNKHELSVNASFYIYFINMK